MSRVIDIEELISIIQVKPIIWNKDNPKYKDRILTKKAWIDVCQEIYGDFEAMSEEDKNCFIKEIMKKWWNIRDGYVRSLKKREELIKSGTSRAIVKKYIYHNQLQFLNIKTGDGATEEPLEEAVELKTEFFEVDALEWTSSDQESLHQRPSIISQKRKISSLDPEDFEVEEPNERHLSFFKGIIPSLNSFNEDDVVEFQMGVLHLISNIRGKKRSNFSNISSTAAFV